MASRPRWGVALDTAGWGHPRLDAAVGVAPPGLALTLWQATRPATHRSTASLAESRSHDPGLRLLHGEHGVPQAPVRPLLLWSWPAGASSSPPAASTRAVAGPSSRRATWPGSCRRRRSGPLLDPRSRQQLPGRLRGHLRGRRSGGDPNTGAGPEREGLCIALELIRTSGLEEAAASSEWCSLALLRGVIAGRLIQTGTLVVVDLGTEQARVAPLLHGPHADAQ